MKKHIDTIIKYKASLLDARPLQQKIYTIYALLDLLRKMFTEHSELDQNLIITFRTEIEHGLNSVWSEKDLTDYIVKLDTFCSLIA